ncbi:hypothetical protein AGR5A_pa30008 [Agrobacterium genomosp. 5 str. CFBP 6626]|nr:hypothetical protein AGR5A_pa30008 [Agrobacterium genomosp. 5 str. CFBP 6626]
MVPQDIINMLGDDQLLDLIGSFVDLRYFCVAHHSLDREVS